MPTRLETLKAERKRLSNRKNLSAAEDRRLQTLSRLIGEEEKKNDPTPGKVYRETTVKKYRVEDGSRWGTTTSQSATRDQLRAQFGMAPLGDLIVEDRDTGYIGLDPTVAKYRFGLQPSRPGGLTGRAVGIASAGLKSAMANTAGARTLSGANGMSGKDMLDFYYSMNDQELIQFQREMVDAGLLDKPTLGFRDPATTEALGVLMKVWMGEPDTPIQDILRKLKSANSARMDEKVREMFGDSGTGVVSDEIANVTVTDSETLNTLIDRMSTELMGGFIDPQVKVSLIAQIQGEEASRKKGLIEADFKSKLASSPQGQAGAELDRFMEALIGKESGGDPAAINPDSGAIGLGQIMPENWGPWAAEAGADPRDFSEANQRKIIKYKLAQYYASYGNWRDVALVWYGGEGGRQRAAAGGGNATEYYNGNAYDSLNQYADSVMAKMNQGVSDALAAGRQPNLQINVMEDLANPQTRIETELRKLDPARYQAKQFGNHAEVFFGLLNGVN